MKIYSKETFFGALALGILFGALLFGGGAYTMAGISVAVAVILMVAACTEKGAQALVSDDDNPRKVMYRTLFGRYAPFAPYMSVVLLCLPLVMMMYYPGLSSVASVLFVVGVAHYAWFLKKRLVYKRQQKRSKRRSRG